MSDDSPLNFPCDIPIKVFGPNSADFKAGVLDIVRGHWAELEDERVAERRSRGGSYVSLTITVYAESRDQIDAAYRELTESEQILMVL